MEFAAAPGTSSALQTTAQLSADGERLEVDVQLPPEEAQARARFFSDYKALLTDPELTGALEGLERDNLRCAHPAPDAGPCAAGDTVRIDELREQIARGAERLEGEYRQRGAARCRHWTLELNHGAVSGVAGDCGAADAEPIRIKGGVLSYRGP